MAQRLAGPNTSAPARAPRASHRTTAAATRSTRPEPSQTVPASGGNEQALRRASHSHAPETPAAPGTPPSASPLNSNELAVLALLADGLTQSRAARRLDISDRTLRRRLCEICSQLQVREPIEAVVWAAKQGYL